MKKPQDLERKLQGYSRSAAALRLVRNGLHSKGVRYSAAAAAGAALAGGSADAALITSGVQGFSATVTGTFTSGPLDIDGDSLPDLFGGIGAFTTSFPGTYIPGTYIPGTGTLPGTSFPGYTSPGFYFAYNFFYLSGYLAELGRSNNFAPGASTTSSVYGSRFFSSSVPGGAGTVTQTRTFAFSFTAGSNTSGTPNAGWLQAVIQFSPNQTRISFPTVVYETTPGAAVHVGTAPATTPVPEPSSVALMGLGLLALGGRGVREMRRRKKKQAESKA